MGERKKITFYDLQKRNKRVIKIITFLPIIIFPSFYVIMGLIVIFTGGEINIINFWKGVLIALIFTAFCWSLYFFIVYHLLSRFMLKKFKAREINFLRKEEITLKNVVEEISIAAGIPVPEIYIIDEPEWLNAFTSGKSKKDASICVTTGLLQVLNRNELQGVIAHEISHIKAEDTKLMFTYFVTVYLLSIFTQINSFIAIKIFESVGEEEDREGEGCVIMLLKFSLGLTFLITALLSWIATFLGKIVSFFISRRMEFLADSASVELTRDPSGLASALIKIENYHIKKREVTFAEAPFFISDPRIKNIRKPSFWERLFSTHPPIEERIKKLLAMGADIQLL